MRLSVLQHRNNIVLENNRRGLLNAARTVRRYDDMLEAKQKEATEKAEFLADRREKLRLLRRELERLSGADAANTIKRWADLPLRKYFRLWRLWLHQLYRERAIVKRTGKVLTNLGLAKAFRAWKYNVSNEAQLARLRAIQAEHASSQTLSEFLLKRMEAHRKDITKQVLNTLTLVTKASLDTGETVQ